MEVTLQIVSLPFEKKKYLGCNAVMVLFSWTNLRNAMLNRSHKFHEYEKERKKLQMNPHKNETLTWTLTALFTIHLSGKLLSLLVWHQKMTKLPWWSRMKKLWYKKLPCWTFDVECVTTRKLYLKNSIIITTKRFEIKSTKNKAYQNKSIFWQKCFCFLLKIWITRKY